MGFQSQVEKYRAKGIAGDKATNNPVVYLPYTAFAENDGDKQVTVGQFVWPGTDADDIKQLKPTGVGAPIAFIERLHRYRIYDVTAEGTLEIPENATVEAVKEGDFYAVALTTAVAGEKVFASNLGLGIKTGVAGAIIADYTETSFKVVEGSAIGDVFLMTNWGTPETVASSVETITAVTSAISLLTKNTYFDTTLGVSTATLADGVEGQEKVLLMTVDNGDQVVTPANLLVGTTITFADIGDVVVLKFIGASWTLISNTGAVVA